MIETFTALVTAHLIADFILQTPWLVERKKQLPYLLLHIAIVAITAAAAIGASTRVAGVMIAIIAVTHLAMDFIKLHGFNQPFQDGWKAFVIDQFVHIAVIAAIACFVPTLALEGCWSKLPGDDQALLYAAMTCASGIITAVPMGGILIKKLVLGLAPQDGDAEADQPSNGKTLMPSGMDQGGKYIGWLERGLTLLFVMTGKIEGVGFLLAAKSILRFGDIRNDTDRHQQEYIIIGTLLSFGWGLSIAMLTAAALRYWGFA